METLIDQMNEALAGLLTSGFQLPIHLAVIARNGAGMVGTYSQGEVGLNFEPHHAHGEKFALPVNIMFVDSQGEAARLVINASDGPPKLILH